MQTSPEVKRATCFVLLAFLLNGCGPSAQKALPRAESTTWLTNLNEAKNVAAQQRKDLLINFTGTEWCAACIELDRDVLSSEAFSALEKEFVFVRLEYPAGVDRLPCEPSLPQVSWRETYGVKSFPTIFLADENGRPYAATGNIGLAASEYVKQLKNLHTIHNQRDIALRSAMKAEGIEKAKGIANALGSVEDGLRYCVDQYNADPLLLFYQDEINRVLQLDQDNREGLRAHFDDIVQREVRRNEAELILKIVNAIYRDRGLDEALGVLDDKISEANSPFLRNRFRRSRLVFLEWGSRHDEALAYARELAKDETYSREELWSIRERIAWNLHKVHEDEEAIAAYDQLIDEVHEDPRARFRSLSDKAEGVLWPAERYSEALECWDTAVNLVARKTELWLDAQAWRLRLLACLGRVDDAWSVYDEMSTGNCTTIDRATWMAMMGVLLDAHGSPAAAVDAASKAQRMLDSDAAVPDSPQVRQARSMIARVITSEKLNDED